MIPDKLMTSLPSTLIAYSSFSKARLQRLGLTYSSLGQLGTQSVLEHRAAWNTERDYIKHLQKKE